MDTWQKLAQIQRETPNMTLREAIVAGHLSLSEAETIIWWNTVQLKQPKPSSGFGGFLLGMLAAGVL